MVIQRRYKELWSWHGTVSEQAQFVNYKMEGTLRKFVQQVKIFQRSLHPKRYFLVDFQAAMLLIMREKGAGEKDTTSVFFRDIVDCYLPKKDMKDELPKNWKQVFYLKTSERLYILLAKTLEDRNMWMAGFRYIIASTYTVQQIIKQNNQSLDQKLVERTKEFQKHETKILSKRSQKVD